MDAFIRLACQTDLFAIMGWTTLSPLAARAAEGSIDLVPRWKQGEKVRYQMVKSRTRMRDGKVVRKNSGRSVLDVEIVKADDEGYIVGWTLGETKVDDPKAAEHPLTQRMLNVLKGFQVVIELDAEASIHGVRNGRQLKATTDEMRKII